MIEQSVSHCVFSTADDAYVPKAIVALLSFSKFNPEYRKYVLCGKLSEENRELCCDLGVTPLELDLSSAFYRTWKYPRECYYHFIGPELFWKLGFSHSVYIDGDTYCNGKFNPDITEPFDIAGVSYDTVGALFKELGEDKKLCEQMDVPGIARQRPQSGVLLYNNPALVKFGFFKRIVDLFDKSLKAGIPRKGDDSLLTLMVGLHPELLTCQLPLTFNAIDYRFPRPRSSDPDGEIISNSIIYHFIRDKPWSKWDEEWREMVDPPSYATRYFARKWREVMINHFSQAQIKRCFEPFYKKKLPEPKDVSLFWFEDGPNFGDWVTPYLVQKITGRPVSASINPLQTKKTVVISTGSIMRLCAENTIVWGSGVRNRDQAILPGKEVRSVRGPLTRKRILEVGGECPPVFGDPALLLPKVYRPEKQTVRFKLGIVPHISQYDAVSRMYKDVPDTNVIDLRTRNVERVIDEIHECSAIASSSLHGIIVAHAYGIPVRWIRFDDNIFGDDTKFADHFASVGRQGEGYINAVRYQKISVPEILEQMLAPGLNVDLAKLWDAGIFHNGELSKQIRYSLAEEESA